MNENERLRILKLLEEGKINAEEAARLLEALATSESRRRSKWPFMDFSHIFEIPEMIFKSINLQDLCWVDTANERTEFASKERVRITGFSGDMTIVGSDTDKIIVEKGGIGRIVEEEKEINLKVLGGEIKICLPRTSIISVTGLSGDIELQGLDNKIEIHTVSGDINGRMIRAEVIVSVMSGDVCLEMLKIDKVEINSKSGDVCLKLHPEVEAAIDLYSRSGDVTCELPIEIKEKRENYFCGIYRSDKGHIKIESHSGDISIKELKA